jgi:hypothetical protein
LKRGRKEYLQKKGKKRTEVHILMMQSNVAVIGNLTKDGMETPIRANRARAE